MVTQNVSKDKGSLMQTINLPVHITNILQFEEGSDILDYCATHPRFMNFSLLSPLTLWSKVLFERLTVA